jgi:signal transduction histidine kinase
VPDSVPVFVADFEYLKAALQQLVENGIKFSADLKSDSRVELRVTYDDKFLYFTVQDWGRGIAEDELERIWEPFYQIDRSMYEDQGAGSGLAIVSGIAKLHGGHVDVVSKVGEGSIFTLLVPLKG